MKTGLVMEGGAMRGLFTAGVLDVRDVQYSMVEGRLCFSCVIESDKGSANIQYEI